MFDKLIEKIVEDKVKPIIADAYKNGYADATTDVCRRLDELYAYGFALGKSDALAEAGMIEIDDDVTRAVEGESA